MTLGEITYRGPQIAHAWNAHELNPAGARYLVIVDNADEQAWLDGVLTMG